MQKVLRQWVEDGQLIGEWCYTAKEVDDYMKAVKALVNEGKKIEMFLPLSKKIRDNFMQAVAAVERLEVE